jgi:nicotinamidase-related amidase
MVNAHRRPSSERSDRLFAEYMQLLGPFHYDSVPPFGPDDALIIMDMQMDMLPKESTTNPDGGQTGIAGGSEVVQPIVQLIDAAIEARATIAAMRNYHPHDHVSFSMQGGHFPAHCVQGTPGARFVPGIADALAAGVRVLGNEKVRSATLQTAPVIPPKRPNNLRQLVS